MAVIAPDASAVGLSPGDAEESQRNVKNELFVNTINNFVFVRKPFITWRCLW